jgi:hypothetical protein
MMNEQDLIALEERHYELDGACASMHNDTYGTPWPCEIGALIAEVRRLRDELALWKGERPPEDYEAVVETYPSGRVKDGDQYNRKGEYLPRNVWD